MKALIISEDKDFTDSISSLLSENELDVINYRMLIKAMDNIEEIKPDMIFLSSVEYPRHWKTLVQFVKSGIGGDNISVFLYNPEEFSEDDIVKVEKLDISHVFTSLEKNELKELQEKVKKLAPSSNINNHKTGKFIFTHPVLNTFITGTVEDLHENTIVCKLYKNTSKLEINDAIKYFTFYNSKEEISYTVEVKEIDNLNKKAIFTIKDKYEKE